MERSSRKSIGILRGGEKAGYSDSIASGSHLLSILHDHPEYKPLDVFIDKAGVWHLRGVPTDPLDILDAADLVWSTLRGGEAENGELQKALKRRNIPHIGSHAVPSALSLNKELSKDLFRSKGLRTPKHAAISKKDLTGDNLLFIFRNYMHPMIVKPVEGTGSYGLSIARTFDELRSSVETLLQEFDRVLVEEYIKGRSVSCGVVEDARGQKLYALIPEPMQADPEMNKRITEAAKLAHELLGLRHYSESDFIITPRGSIYILETDAVPKIGRDSSFVRSLDATGWKPADFAEHIIRLSL